MPLDLTIAIPVRNEAQNLPGCLEAIGPNFARSVVVIDSGSTDATKEIALAHGASAVDFCWNGVFPKKRNWFLRHHFIATKWILFLDADEYLTAPFKTELAEALANDKGVEGYWLNYSIYFMGKKLKGGYPLAKLALFKVGAGEYERIDEEGWSRLDMEIHEHPVLKGKVGTLKSKIDHRDFRGFAHHAAKHEEYAAWEAARYIKMMSDENRNRTWTWRQKAKYRLMGSVWIGPAFLLGSFFLMGGFKDGVRGLAFALFKMGYFNGVYCRICERRQSVEALKKLRGPEKKTTSLSLPSFANGGR